MRRVSSDRKRARTGGLRSRVRVAARATVGGRSHESKAVSPEKLSAQSAGREFFPFRSARFGTGSRSGALSSGAIEPPSPRDAWSTVHYPERTGILQVRCTQRTRVDKYGFPRGYPTDKKRVRGFATGDTVLWAEVPSGRRRGRDEVFSMKEAARLSRNFPP